MTSLLWVAALIGMASLIPEGESLTALQRDYEDMVASGFLDEHVTFESVFGSVLEFQEALNAFGAEG